MTFMEDDLLDQKKEQEEKLLLLAVSVYRCVCQCHRDAFTLFHLYLLYETKL